MVVLLHGVGANGDDLIQLAPYFAQALPEAEFLAPDAPFHYDMAPFGRQWFSLRDRTPQAILAGVRAAAPVLDDYLDGELRHRGLGDQDLALIGFSQGTMMALHVALRRPRACAAVVGYSGALVGPELLADDKVSAPPVLLVHGDADEVVPVDYLAIAAGALREAGLDVHSQVRPGLGHGLDEDGIALGAAFLRQHLAPKA
jgi:phospholipase/carboxylesterase